jgi:MEMO1 family protein
MTSKWQLGFLLVVAVGVVGVMRWGQGLRVSQPPTRQSNAAASPQPAIRTKVVVLPHHDILSPEFNAWYQDLAATQNLPVKTVILLSPNHFQPHQQREVTTDQPLSFGRSKTVDIDQQLVSQLASQSSGVDRQVFINEHGVNIHLPYIKQYFPEAKVVPLLLTRNIPQNRVEALSTFLSASLVDPGTLIIASVDFSHNVPRVQAQEYDQLTITLVEENKPTEVLKLDDRYLDCPACLYLTLKAADQLDLDRSPLLFHNDATNYLGLGDHSPTTSYLIWHWYEAGRQSE